MKEYSEAEVVDAINRFNEAKNSFPDSGTLKASVNDLQSIIEIIGECWKTTGSEKEITKLNMLISKIDNLESIETEIASNKSVEISYSSKKVID